MQQCFGGNIVPGCHLSTIYFPFHASHKARVFRECENKNMKIFTSVASIWYVEDSKIDFKNENTAHGNRLLLFYKSKIIEIEKDEYFSDNCKKYSHCSTNSKPNSAYCSSTNSHCVQKMPCCHHCRAARLREIPNR